MLPMWQQRLVAGKIRQSMCGASGWHSQDQGLRHSSSQGVQSSSPVQRQEMSDDSQSASLCRRLPAPSRGWEGDVYLP